MARTERVVVTVTLEGSDARDLAIRVGAWVRQMAGSVVCPDVAVTVQTEGI
jgi:hypothetical protein